MILDEKVRKTWNEDTGESNRVYDFDYALRYVRRFLRLLGIWPLVAITPIRLEYVLSRHLLLPLVSISMISLTFPVCFYAITQPIERLEKFILLAPITFEIGNILMHFCMMIRSGPIKICFEHMEHDWRINSDPREHDIMRRYVRFSHAMTIACLVFMYSGAVSYSLIMPLLAGNTINEMNVTLRPRPLPGTELFFDVQANVIYEIVFAANFISAVFHYTVTTTVCSLAIVFVCHACGQIKIVISSIETFVDGIGTNDDTARHVGKRIRLVVRKHVRLLKFTMSIENALNEMMLLEVVASTLIICFIEYDILMILEAQDGDRLGMLTYIVLLFSFGFNLFLYCQFGEFLKGQCEKVGKIAYLIDWFKLPGRTKLALIMIINISNHPCKLTAGGIMELSIVNFASVLKSSFAYFNMMRNMG